MTSSREAEGTNAPKTASHHATMRDAAIVRRAKRIASSPIRRILHCPGQPTDFDRSGMSLSDFIKTASRSGFLITIARRLGGQDTGKGRNTPNSQDDAFILFVFGKGGCEPWI
jgi:hypothetical protein